MKKKVLLTFIITTLFSLVIRAGEPICHLTHYDEFSGLAQWNVTQIVQDKQGMMWFATWNGLNRFDGYEFECFKSEVGNGIDIPSDRIRDIVLDKDGNILCQYDDHVLRFDLKTCKYQSLPPQEEQKLLNMFQKRLDHIRNTGDHPIRHTDAWGVTWEIHKDGIIRYQEKGSNTWTDYHPNIEPTTTLYYSLTDKQGNVWMRSEYGAYKLTFSQKPHVRVALEKPTQVRNFLIDRKQRTWLTTRDDAIIKLYDQSNHLLGYLGQRGGLHHAYTTFGSPIYHLLQAQTGTIWLCSKPNGLFRLRETGNGTFSVEQFRHNDADPYSIPNDELYYSAIDPAGRLWVATFNKGIACIEHPEAKDIRFVHGGNGLKYPKVLGNRVRQIYITKKGILLAATTTGLIVADVTKKDVRQIQFKLHTRDAHRSSSLSNNATMFVMEDSKHRIFVCTESGGVNQILSKDLLQDQLEFKHFDTTTGLPSDITLSAIEEGDHLLIVSSNQLITLRPDDNQMENFDSHFFQERVRFSDAVPTLLPDGRRIFGLQNGAFTIMPQSLRKSGYVPSIALTSISVEKQAPNLAVNVLDTLILSSHERNFTITFSALDYTGEAEIHYAFQMGDNGNNAWNYVEKTHTATFLDLRPGTHLLKIRSTNGDGVWVDNTRILTIIVKPTFWETTWAKLLYILLIAAIVYAILRTHRHITELSRKQKETHEAYLALLNATNTEKQDGKPQVEETIPQPQIKPEDDMFMKRAMKFIEEHIDDPNINIGDMAEATATSRSGLNRKMKSLLGVTPLDFIREARIRKACKMLAMGMAVNDVAYGCGFSDPKYFGKCFKADMGMTPTEYKMEKKGKL